MDTKASSVITDFAHPLADLPNINIIHIRYVNALQFQELAFTIY